MHPKHIYESSGMNLPESTNLKFPEEDNSTPWYIV